MSEMQASQREPHGLVLTNNILLRCEQKFEGLVEVAAECVALGNYESAASDLRFIGSAIHPDDRSHVVVGHLVESLLAEQIGIHMLTSLISVLLITMTLYQRFAYLSIGF